MRLIPGLRGSWPQKSPAGPGFGESLPSQAVYFLVAVLGLEELDELELDDLVGVGAGLGAATGLGAGAGLGATTVLGVGTGLGAATGLGAGTGLGATTGLGAGTGLGVTTGLGGGVVCRLWYCLGTAMLR